MEKIGSSDFAPLSKNQNDNMKKILDSHTVAGITMCLSSKTATGGTAMLKIGEFVNFTASAPSARTFSTSVTEK